MLCPKKDAESLINISETYSLTMFSERKRIVVLGKRIEIRNYGDLLVVVHTFNQINKITNRIRIISARKATKRESKQYKEENL